MRAINVHPLRPENTTTKRFARRARIKTRWDKRHVSPVHPGNMENLASVSCSTLLKQTAVPTVPSASTAAPTASERTAAVIFVRVEGRAQHWVWTRARNAHRQKLVNTTMENCASRASTRTRLGKRLVCRVRPGHTALQAMRCTHRWPTAASTALRVNTAAPKASQPKVAATVVQPAAPDCGQA